MAGSNEELSASALIEQIMRFAGDERMDGEADGDDRHACEQEMRALLQRLAALAPAQEPAGGGEVGTVLDELTALRDRYPGGMERLVMDRLIALATPTPQAAGAAPEGLPEFEFEVWQGGAWQAGGTAQTLDDAIREASHYEMMYGQDGPVEVKLYERRAIPQPGAQEQSA